MDWLWRILLLLFPSYIFKIVLMSWKINTTSYWYRSEDYFFPQKITRNSPAFFFFLILGLTHFWRAKIQLKIFFLSLFYGRDLVKWEIKWYCIWDTLLRRDPFWHLEKLHYQWEKLVLPFLFVIRPNENKSSSKIYYIHHNKICMGLTTTKKDL